MVASSIPYFCYGRHEKARLVDLGLACLARGEWQMVAVITRLIERRGWRHA
jgi:hypothetical protein